MSEPTSPDWGAPERLHPLFLLSGLGGSLRSLTGGYALLGYLAVSGRMRTALFVAMGLVVIMVVSVFLYWRRFEFRVGTNEIRIDSGILSRTHRSIPFDRVHDVDISQGPVARLLGLASLRLETGASAGANADEGVLQAITLERAQELRTLIRAGRSVASATPVPIEVSGKDGAPVFALTMPRLLLLGLFNFSLALFAGLIGLTETFGDVMGFDPFSDDFWRELFSANSPIAAYILAHRAIAIASGIVLLLLAGAATGILRTVLRDFGFRLDRTETSLRRRRGLLTKTDVSLPIRRVQAALVASGPIRDHFGWRELKLQNLARDEGSGDHVVAPIADAPEVDRILGELGWPPASAPVAWRPVANAYVWARAVALAPFILIFGTLLALLALTPLALNSEMRAVVAREFVSGMLVTGIPLLLLLGAVATRWLAWKRTAFALAGDRLLVRSGWWRRRLRILPVSKIQSIDIAESFVSRWLGISTLIFGVAGGGGFSAHNIPAVPRREARELRDQLLSSTP
ncbi:MAG: PH domain-containing protein [Pseudomonadota bacterium]|nr:PH domain-containing protein [Pseudomonadota bacterium]